MKTLLILLMMILATSAFADSKASAQKRLEQVKQRQTTYQQFQTDMTSTVNETNNQNKYNEYVTKLFSIEGQMFVQKGLFEKARNIEDQQRIQLALNELISQYNTLASEFEKWVNSL